MHVLVFSLFFTLVSSTSFAQMAISNEDYDCREGKCVIKNRVPSMEVLKQAAFGEEGKNYTNESLERHHEFVGKDEVIWVELKKN